MKSKPSIKNVTCRLYPTKEQEEFLALCCTGTRSVYNYYLGRVKDKKCKISTKYFQSNLKWLKTRSKQKVKDYEVDFTYLKKIPSISLQIAVQNLGKAFDNFYKKYNKDCGFPRFKTKGISRESFAVSGEGKIRVVDSDNKKIKYLNISKDIGNIKMKGSISLLPVDISLVKRVTIYKSVDKWYASFTISFKPIKLPKTGKVIGLDLSLTRFYTTSNGRYELAEDINPTLLLKRIKFYDKILARIRRTYKRLHPRKEWIKSNRYLKI